MRRLGKTLKGDAACHTSAAASLAAVPVPSIEWTQVGAAHLIIGL